MVAEEPSEVRATAPGRVNLIGDHTDHTGGLVLPMAIDLATVVEGRRGGDAVVVTSEDRAGRAVIGLDGAIVDGSPGWSRYVAGVVAEVAPSTGLDATVRTTLPLGGGLSSSAALEVAVALALGGPDDPVELARLCRRAEQRATGVPCGIMDQLASAAGVEGHALLIDCHEETVRPVPMPSAIEVVVVDSGQARELVGSPYAERVAACRAAEVAIGPLRRADPSDLAAIDDPTIRRRARHVVTENARVRAAVEALRAGDLAEVGRLVDASHESLRHDFEVSTPELDDLVARLRRHPGVLGARLTGAGFGGCVVALARPGALAGWAPERSWTVTPARGAHRVTGLG